MGMVLFSRAGTEVLVLRPAWEAFYDVTNVVERPLVSVITSVSIDHTAFLSHTAGEIAVHKAGIIKPGCPAVYDDSCPEAETVILDTAEKKGSPAFLVGCVPFRLEGGIAGLPVGLPGKDRGIYCGLSGSLPGRERSPLR